MDAAHRTPRSARHAWLFTALFVALLMALFAVPVWALLTSQSEGTTVTASPAATDSAHGEASAGATEAMRALDELADVSGRSVADYDRALFGQRWYDQDRNGCDTRNDILRRDLMNVVIKADTNGCKVLSGTLLDPYTGETLDFVSGADTSVLVQIDHLVPLAWAWRHGAEHWTDDRRTAFANDPANLVATSGHVNQSKSDSGPGSWLPPDPAAHCEYAVRYITVLGEYGLGVGGADRQTLERALETC